MTTKAEMLHIFDAKKRPEQLTDDTGRPVCPVALADPSAMTVLAAEVEATEYGRAPRTHKESQAFMFVRGARGDVRETFEKLTPKPKGH